jgi:hypothetical protein
VIKETSFSLNSWQDVAVLVGVVSALFTILGGLITASFNRRKSLIEKKSADDAASDRLIRLIETEAEKKVEIVRTEFKLQIAEAQLEHSRQLTAMRTDFEKQLAALRKEHDTYRCEHALTCTWRFKATPPPASLPVVS